MLLDTSVDTTTGTDATVAPVVSRFPSAELVEAAAGLFAREVQPPRVVPVRIGSKAVQAHEQRRADHHRATGQVLPWLGDLEGLEVTEHGQEVEGPRWYVEVAPGVLRVRSSDPARAQRAAERALEDHRAKVTLEADAIGRGEELPEGGHREITGWSAKSRSRMTLRLAQLDYTPMLAEGCPLAMATLTYPGDWYTVAPDAATCHRHLLAFRKRFERRYKRRLVAIWKREFQRRGAPHYHLLMPIPADVNGESFRDWLGRTWAAIVGHPDPDERARHAVAGTGVDFVEGSRMSDPKRAGVYFSKHGAFAAKEYQNQPPEEWAGTPAGRFWGYWHLEPATAAVEVAPDVARAVVRTARRYAAAQRPTAEVYRWRKVTTVDRETGELGWKWRKRKTRVRVHRLTRAAGYLVVNDGPVFASQLARWSSMAVAPDRRRGPLVRGWLP